MKVLDLFSGIGGFSLGLERAGMKTIAFCEIDKFCQDVLRKHWKDTPIHTDIKLLKKDEIKESVDLICGGYPCQPYSLSGNRGGEKDNRSLWSEMFRLISCIKPRWVIAENVIGHITLGLDKTLSDLESADYTCWTFILPAIALKGRHCRARVWVVAYAAVERLQGSSNPDESEGETGNVRQEFYESSRVCGSKSKKLKRQTERGLGGGSDGLPAWLDGFEYITNSDESIFPRLIVQWHGMNKSRISRIKALGNSVVPQIPEILGRAIMEIENFTGDSRKANNES